MEGDQQGFSLGEGTETRDKRAIRGCTDVSALPVKQWWRLPAYLCWQEHVFHSLWTQTITGNIGVRGRYRVKQTSEWHDENVSRGKHRRESIHLLSKDGPTTKFHFDTSFCSTAVIWGLLGSCSARACVESYPEVNGAARRSRQLNLWVGYEPLFMVVCHAWFHTSKLCMADVFGCFCFFNTQSLAPCFSACAW